MTYTFLQPYTFKNGMTVKNRIVIPPMTEASALQDGTVSRDELAYFRQHTGGVGLFIGPVANVSADGKGFEGELAITQDDFIPGLSEMASTMKRNGTKAILQIFHAGRMTNSKILRGTQPVSASAVASPRPGMAIPRALTDTETRQIIDDFGTATRRAIQAGFDGVEIHGANTYLIQQFFSPHSNRRQDQWGGTLENRMQFGLAVIKAVKAAVDQYATQPFLVGYRISPEEIEQPGIRLEETLKFVDVLAQQPLDYLHVSMGNVWRKSLNDPAEQEATNLRIQKVLAGRLPLIVVGSLKTPADVQKVMDAGITFAALGRESLREPKWVEKVAANLEGTIRYQFNQETIAERGINNNFRKYLMGMGIDFNEDGHSEGQSGMQQSSPIFSK
ncbi:NADH-dependent flavin oxidoreductase [Levilactobacillus brevis]|uniref:NADH-dependent flavin oxidoreductase n=1 Tax=Levilactobacillus brevis TaxID=1580 RepID=UPI000A202BD5|nr:NADH-dependent flavin oxidoreductase [Levilactobacillus brevis]ARN89122.1 NADH-dependent flavin oxidoreductase [Levilactobacillus brevis]ARN96700.1 NADH-dependent flavin oxidoreductase [Levilactobacillus brevis]